MKYFRSPLIFATLFIAGFSLFFFVDKTQAGTSDTVIMTVKISVCGNDVLEGGEQCDGNSINNRDCSYLGYSSGALSCTASCEFDASNCDTSAEENTAAVFSASASGSQTLSDGEREMAIQLPADFYSDSLLLEMFSYSSTATPDLKLIPAGKQFLGKKYNLNFFDSNGNSVSTLSKPVTISITYSDSDIDGIAESTIKPYKSEDGDSSWQLISNSTLDTENNIVTFTESSFSWFVLLGSAPDTDTGSNSDNSNIGSKHHFIYLSRITDKSIKDYIDNVLSILDFSNNKNKENKNEEKSAKQDEKSAEKATTSSKESKAKSAAKNGNSNKNKLNDPENTSENNLKVILASLMIVFVVLARLAALL